MYKNGVIYDDVEMGKIFLKSWMLFVDKEHFKDTLRDYCLQEGFALVFNRSEELRYIAVCADERCGWRIHAARLVDGYTWEIKTMNQNYNCDLNLVTNPMVNCEWVARKLLEHIRANMNIRGKTMNEFLWDRYGVRMATPTLYKMKDKFKGLIDGCKGLVGVDGTHLKGNFGGILLAAVSLDGNNKIFPVAVAVVGYENKTSWSWFFHHLKATLTASGRSDWTIMSVWQKGIDPSLDQVWPKVPRRYCERHLCKNFKTDYLGILMHKLFWSVVKSCSQYTFKKALQKIQKVVGLGAIKWFKDMGPLDRWTKWKFDPTLCNDKVTNNFVESFNSTIGADRCNPILTLLYGVRRIAMVRHATRQHLSQQWVEPGICPNIREKVRYLTKKSRSCQAYPSGGESMRWQVSGIPCKHGIKAILDAVKDPLDYVLDWFSVSRYKAAYNGSISPIPNSEQWPDLGQPTLIPPTMKRGIGRPSRNRRREEGEQKKGKISTTVQCKKCKDFGHNSKACKAGATTRELREQQGGGVQPRPEVNSQASKRRQSQSSGPIEVDSNLIDLMINQSQPDLDTREKKGRAVFSSKRSPSFL
ncbi:uncharacterized protein LOC104883482 [Beta vulgaris subsp. vulgaris]|uniref:uncharacterized protein LOC104883482 n=1 Tax=Beta vulgaris subsp. vulgaris TaxID=3555 RepID=UPI0020374089|nr:uncharacterized protein LOC104883482 [Beta vulgaris subsp. vulgaris]